MTGVGVMNYLQVALVVLLPTVSMSAQEKPNFSGVWRCDLTRSTVCVTDVMIITHVGDWLSLQPPRANALPQTYRLDGVEVVVLAPTHFGGRAAAPFAATSRWIGTTLVTRLRSLGPEMSAWVNMHLSDAANELFIGAGVQTASGGTRTTSNVFVRFEP